MQPVGFDTYTINVMGSIPNGLKTNATEVRQTFTG